MSKVIKYTPANGQISKKEKKKLKDQAKTQKNDRELTKQEAELLMRYGNMLRDLGTRYFSETLGKTPDEQTAILDHLEKEWFATVDKLNFINPEIELRHESFRSYVLVTVPENARKAAEQKNQTPDQK